MEEKANFTKYSQEDIDRYWNQLNGIIVHAADKMIANEDAKSRWTRKITKYNLVDYATSTENSSKSDYKKYKTSEVKSIKDWIDKRVEIIRDDQTTWLSSILDKNIHTNIVIDKVLVDEEPGVSTKRLATNLGEVKKAVDNDFANMFRKRNTQLNALTPFWQHIYKFTGKFKEVIEVTTKNITLVK
ncbi:hypothetical protein C1646_761118 [Rhizophagus diaphanus]|nr:hypothetical protein C1646_761118 [Rhizophagus diaphanus] [Rhizophagus sp. MUCL 43196]